MLAPPPEGTFDLDDPNLPIINPLKDGANTANDSSDEKVPLLEDVPSDSNQLKKGKVRIS